jgi:hypothetical protein
VLLAVTLVMAEPATKIPFTGSASFVFGNDFPGEVWITDDGIYHVKGAVSRGDANVYHPLFGPMEGTMIMEHDLVLNLNTGLGHCHGKVVIEVPGVGTFEGSEHGSHMIADRHYISGSLVAKGTGGFNGLKMKGSYEGEMLNQVAEAEMEGTLLSPNR